MADVIQAQYVKLQTLTTEQSVRVTFDIPYERMADFVHLFPKPGAGAAIARLVEEAREAEHAPVPETKRKWDDMTPAQQAGILCNDPLFAEFAAYRAGRSSIDAADWVRGQCGVDSRAQLNTNPDATENWLLVEADFQSWLTTHQYEDIAR